MVGMVAAIVVAAGRGLRVGGGKPKQYRMLASQPVIRPSLAALASHPGIAVVQPVIHSDDVERFEDAAAGLNILPAVFGGATRQTSVRAGLEALTAHKPELVLVHDAARPFASTALIGRAIAAARQSSRRLVNKPPPPLRTCRDWQDFEFRRRRRAEGK